MALGWTSFVSLWGCLLSWWSCATHQRWWQGYPGAYRDQPGWHPWFACCRGSPYHQRCRVGFFFELQNISKKEQVTIRDHACRVYNTTSFCISSVLCFFFVLLPSICGQVVWRVMLLWLLAEWGVHVWLVLVASRRTTLLQNSRWAPSQWPRDKSLPLTEAQERWWWVRFQQSFGDANVSNRFTVHGLPAQQPDRTRLDIEIESQDFFYVTRLLPSCYESMVYPSIGCFTLYDRLRCLRNSPDLLERSWSGRMKFVTWKLGPQQNSDVFWAESYQRGPQFD